MSQRISKRDEFSKDIREAVAKRAHYVCSNPDCLKLTAGPHSDPKKALLTGIAAHINAAAENGPRFDPNQGTARRGASNAIWLCHDCSDLVDKDEVQYPAELLRQWKLSHESMISELRVKGYSHSVQLLQAQILDVNLLQGLLAAELPKENADVGENYTELLGDLFQAGIDTPLQLKRLLGKYHDRILGEDRAHAALEWEALRRGEPVDNEERVRRGVFFTHVGWVRSLLVLTGRWPIDVGGEW